MTLQDLANELYLRKPSHKFQVLDHELPDVRNEYMQKAITRARELIENDHLHLDESEINIILGQIAEQEERL